MLSSPDFRVRYWGTRGSLAKPLGPEAVTDKLVEAITKLAKGKSWGELEGGALSTLETRQHVERHLPYYLRSCYGGNTTCLEIQAAETLIIIDAGSGFQQLGVELGHRWDDGAAPAARTAHVLLTHAHMDHVCGFPFGNPIYDRRNHFTIHASAPVIKSLHTLIAPDSAAPSAYFPLSWEAMHGIKEWREIEPGAVFKIDDVAIDSHALSHPGGCLAFSFERNHRKLVFASDHEQRGTPDQELAGFARGADLFYVDAQYLQAEYDGRIGVSGDAACPRRGWGHSTVESSIATAVASGVQRVHLAHHDPNRSDADLAQIEDDAKEILKRHGSTSCEVRLANEGLVTEIG